MTIVLFRHINLKVFNLKRRLENLIFGHKFKSVLLVDRWIKF